MSYVTISTSGFWCGDCLALLRRAFDGVRGVRAISESGRERVVIEFDDRVVDRAEVVETLRLAGFGSEVAE